jgi:hypothetical protein
MDATRLRVFEVNLSLGTPDSIWTVTAWSSRNQAESGKYTVRSDIKQDEFFDLLEELGAKITAAHKGGDDFITMQTDQSHIARDPNFPLPSHSAAHIDEALRATTGVSAMLETIRSHVTPPRRRRKK